MHNSAVAKIFDQMADIMEIRGKGSDKFRILSYRKAALTIADLAEDVSAISERGELEKIPGIGKSTCAKIQEYLETGKVKRYEEMKSSFPADLLTMLNIQSLGPKGVKTLYTELGIETMADLKKAIDDNKIAELDNFGEKSQQNILEGLKRMEEVSDRILLGQAYPLVHELLEMMKACPSVKRVEAAGSFRRRRETIGDIDILASGSDHEKILDYFVGLKEVQKILGRGPTKASVIMSDSQRQVDLRVVDDEVFGSALQYFTGSKDHNVKLRTIAKEKGYKISEYGIFKGEECVASNTEKELYAVLGMDVPEPELRENGGEVEAALKKTLPNLIQLKDIHGDLHMHTKWSDGKNSIQEMAEAARERGYSYLALTDHSPTSRVANGLSVDRLVERNAEIKQIAQKIDFPILIGSEVDILPDGSLDYPDEVLATLDVVVASIHSRFNQDNTERLLAAIENKHVKIIGHPSGRLIGRRPPYPYDFDAVMKAAQKHDTALEINSSFPRMDITDKQARKVFEHGGLISINTDSHNSLSLWMMDLGISIARRGWLEKKAVINCWSYKKLHSWLWKGR